MTLAAIARGILRAQSRRAGPGQRGADAFGGGIQR
jgi:hypothetical protein